MRRRGGKALDGLADDLRDHLERQTEENIARGMTPEEARRQAHITLGSLTLIEEDTRAVWIWRWIDGLRQDVRYALRTFRRAPVFSFAAVLSLALAIGAATAVFLVLDAVLVRPLPYADPSRLVLVHEFIPQALDEGYDNVAPANYADLNKLTSVFGDLAAHSDATVTLTVNGDAQRLDGGTISANTFDLLGAPAEIGRTLTTRDQDPSSPRVIVLSHRTWIQRFGGDRAVAGRVVDVDGRPTTIIGVMPAEFRFPGVVDDFWVPFRWTADALRQRSNHFLLCVGRLASGASVSSADAAVATLARTLERDYPETNAQLIFHVAPLDAALTQTVRPGLTALMAAVLVMFVIACVNVANLTLTRTIARSGELSVRLAIGARPGRLVWQLALEALAVAIGGAAGASLLFQWISSILLVLLPAGLVPADATAIDWRLIAFLGLAAAFAAIVSTATSLIVLFRRRGWSGVQQPTRVTSGTPGERRLRHALVAGEVTLALTLLVTAGLLLRSFANVLATPAGFQPDHVLTAEFAMTGSTYAKQEARLGFVRATLDRVLAIPGVQSAGFITRLPLTPGGGSSWFTRENLPAVHPEEIIATNRLVTPGYFQALRIPLRAGRSLDDRDAEGRPPVALVNETAAKRFWPGESPVGRRFKFGPPDSDKPWVTIVGVVADVHQTSLETAIDPEVYRPVDQDDQGWLAPRALVVRSNQPPTAIASGVREALRAVDPRVAVTSVQPYSAILERSTTPRRVITLAVMAFASLALLLAVVGIAGIVAYTVTSSRREIAVRLALGARRESIVRWTIGRTVPAVAAGVVLGCSAAMVATRWVGALLFHVSPLDLVTFAGVAGFVLAAAAAAAYLPARRAGRIDPATLLRGEA